MSPSLTDQNIYAYNILQSTRTNLDQNYSYLFSTLLHLESEMEYGNMAANQFAENLVMTINQSQAFRQIDRACLAITHPGCSKITALSSYNTNRLGKNQMSTSYNCFVSTNSSIFKTKKSNIRTYCNIDDIVSSYAGKPTQRSLRLLKEMGVKSGITIPLSISNLVSGFLFLNSAQEATFSNLKAEDYSTLCLIKLVGLSCLNKTLFGVNGVDSRIGNVLASASQVSNSFTVDPFKSILGAALESRFKKKVKLEIQNRVQSKFFYATSPTVYIIIKVIECLEKCPDELQIELTEKSEDGKDHIELRIAKASIDYQQLASLQDFMLFSNQKIGVSGGDFFLMTPKDTSETVDYSV